MFPSSLRRFPVPFQFCLWQTNIRSHKVKLDRWEKKLSGLDDPWDGDREAFVAEHGLSEWDDALGTVGGGVLGEERGFLA